MFKSLRNFARGYKLISGTGDAGHGWDFPNGIREMDMMMVQRGTFSAAEHAKRVEVHLAFSHAFERENPDFDTKDIPPHLWAMAVFIMCIAAMRENRNFSDATEIAVEYALKHDIAVPAIEWCIDWARERHAEWQLKRP